MHALRKAPLNSTSTVALTRCDQEIAEIEEKARSGHPDVKGIALGLHDWSQEKRLIEAEAVRLREAEAYDAFLRSKVVVAQERGLYLVTSLNPSLKPHARDIAAWAIRGGNRAVFASFGLAKTSIQLQIMASIVPTQDRPGLIVCPLGVKHEFVKEDLARGFNLHPEYVRTDSELEKAVDRGQNYFLTNYERIREGTIDPNRFSVVSLDEASVLRSYGSKTFQTFLPLFSNVPFKFVCTATPSPNRYKELIHYAGFLGVMDTGQALTRWFKRDSTQAGNLTLHPHKAQEFHLWLSTWATFCTTPSDLGHSDEGYDIPPLRIHRHRLPVDHSTAGVDSWGQGKLLRNAAISLREAAREKRDSLAARIQRMLQIIDDAPLHTHWLIWHDLEDERRAIEKALPEAATVYGTQDLDERERIVEEFSAGELEILATKPILSGSGSNFQYHCHSAIYLGLGYKFNDFIQSLHRIHRFLQSEPVDVHLIYTESEDAVYDALMKKWEQDNRLRDTMSQIIKEYGLNNARASEEMQRSIGVTRQEEKGERYTAVNNDNVAELSGWQCDNPEEKRREDRLTAIAAREGDKLLPSGQVHYTYTERIAANSVDLIVTSVPFGNHYEYTESYNDYGHTEGDQQFFEQMDFLTPHLLRVLKPGRMYCLHCKDRLLYGSVTHLGMYSVNPFSDKCVAHCHKHGFIYCGRISIVTDVVRENNQTYRLGWTEKCKDGTKMGVGSPEYVLLFRKLPTDRERSYADEPVVKSKEDYTRSRWQFDASPFWRSRGDRFLSLDEITQLPQETLRAMWHEFNSTHLYDFDEHVKIAEELERRGQLPASFMLLDPKSHSPWVWDDVVRMRTLNTEQSRKRQEMHICPLQFDVVERLIETYSNVGELVLDPFAGLFTVPYLAVKMRRRGYGIELSSDYFVDGVAYCRAAEREVTTPTLFDALEHATND